MAGFENTLANIPGLGGYLAQKQMNEQQGMSELQQLGGSMGILAKIQAQQQQNELKGLLQQSGGDPGKAIQTLVSAGTPQSLELAAKLKGFLPKPAEPYNLPPGGQRRGLNNEILAEAPFKPQADTTTADPLSRVMAARNKLAESNPNHPMLKSYDAYIAKLTTHQAPVNVYSGSMVPGVNAKGESIFVQPSSREGVAPRPVEGIYPPERTDQRKSAAAAQESAATAQSVRNRIAKMSTLIQGGAVAGGVVGPLGLASRIAETGIGAVKPDTNTPAIDFSNEQALLLADVRKMVEKDPNLSKDERERLYETLGGGIMQTPGSSMRTLKNVLDYVESKKVSGPSRAASLERRAPAVGTTKNGYKFKGGDPANKENWEKM